MTKLQNPIHLNLNLIATVHVNINLRSKTVTAISPTTEAGK